MPTFEPAPPKLPAQIYQDRTANILSRQFVHANLEEISGFDIVVFSLRAVLTDEGAQFVSQLRQRNPDIIVLAAHEVLSRPEVWGSPEQRQRYPVAGELFDFWSDHLLHRMDGEPALMWDRAQMVDPTSGANAVDRNLLKDYVDRIVWHARNHSGSFDGILHDYMSTTPWLYPDGPAGGTAVDVDLDGDGVGSTRDPRDGEIWAEWQRLLLEEFQARFGPGLIQVANGNLGIQDPRAAAQMSGVLYQHFPRTVWGYTDLEGFEIAVRQSGSELTPRRGRVWSILEAETVRAIGDVDFRRLASLLTGMPYVWRSSTADEYFGRDTHRYDIGEPLGPMERITLPDGGVRYSRRFSSGSAMIEFDSMGMQRQLSVEVDDSGSP